MNGLIRPISLENCILDMEELFMADSIKLYSDLLGVVQELVNKDLEKINDENYAKISKKLATLTKKFIVRTLMI